jgi:hypothetical protein
MRRLILAMLLSLTSCTTTLPSKAEILAELHLITPEGIQRAIEINTIAGDLEGLMCAKGIQALLTEEASTPLPQPVDAFSGLAYARAIRYDVQSSTLLRRINLSCAPAFNETLKTWGEIVAKLGSKVLSGGMAP